MDTYLKRTLRGWEPADEQAAEACKRFKVGDVVKSKLVKPRNYKHHKMYFGLLTLTFDNQEKYTSFEMFRKAVQIAAGHVEEIITLEGEVIFQAKSIAYESLDELEFSVVFSETMKVCAKILGDMDLHELEMEVLRAA